MDKPKYPSYVLYNDRLDSFMGVWPRGLPVKPIPLAMEGFFYMGRSDIIVCYHCGGGLRNLEADDDIKKIHASLYGNCHFLYKTYNRVTVNQWADVLPTPDYILRSIFVSKEDVVVIRMQKREMKIKKLKEQNDTLKKMHARLVDVSFLKMNSIMNLTLQNCKLSEELSKFKAMLECPVCLSTSKDAVLFCDHTCCKSCASNLKRCPICSQSRIP